MKFTSAFSFSALLAIAAAAKSFGVITINSGGDYHLSSILDSDSKVTVGSYGKDAVKFVLNDDNSLVDANTNKYLVVDNQNIVEASYPDNNFGINTSGLVYNGKAEFTVDPKTKQLTINTSGKNVGVGLKVLDEKKVDDIHPKSSKKEAASSKKNVKFGVITINSGGNFHYNSIKKVKSHPHVFSVGGTEGSDVSFTLKSDTTLVDQDGKGIYVDPKTGELGDVAPFGRQAPSKGFAIKDGDLVYQGKNNWKACPSGDNKYSLANNDCVGGTGIGLYAVKPTTV